MVWIRKILANIKQEFSIKNCTVLFKEELVKKYFVLGLFDKKIFFKKKRVFFFEAPLKPKSINSNSNLILKLI